MEESCWTGLMTPGCLALINLVNRMTVVLTEIADTGEWWKALDSGGNMKKLLEGAAMAGQVFGSKDVCNVRRGAEGSWRDALPERCYFRFPNLC